MKKSIIYIFILLIFSGCEKVLDKKELNSIDGRDIWNDPELADLYLNNTYNLALPSFAGSSNTNLSDESIGSGTDFMMYGLLTKESSYGIFNSNRWYIIRQLNTMLEGLNEGTMSDDDKKLLLGQVYFLRAWTYWEFVLYYGGVPLILSSIDPAAYEQYQIPRNSAHECIDQIIKDLDSALDLLPTSWPNSYGRVTSSTAAALKGRVLLFYASLQFNPDNILDRWQTAYEANQTAVQICEDNGHALYSDYASIFLDEANTTEAIFFTVYDNTNKYNGYEASVRPRSISNSTDAVGSAPNWDFVKSYPMSDGSSIDNSPEYDSIYFWKNRDPRFYATIAYNGMSWPIGSDDDRIQWTYNNNTAEPSTAANGASLTGFYLKKNIDNSITRLETVYGPTDWIEIRLAEVYLNYAECAAEIGEIQTAKEYLIKIRERAGIEAGSDGSYGISATTKEEMIEAVLLERKIELAFENKRHWDLRRRNMYIENLYNTPKINGTRRHGIEIDLDTSYIVSLVPELSGKEDSIYYYFENVLIDTIDLDKSYDKYFITKYNVELEQTEINYLQPEYNFFFIPNEELEKNTDMQQTIYWTDVDPFDPLANN
jgi:hypothetical protein